MPPLPPAIRVEVWSDVACPWCWIGKRRLDAAVARLPEPERVEVVFRSFELDRRAPRAPRSRLSYAARLARKYRATEAQARAMVERIGRAGAEEGLELRLDRVHPSSTFDAHRLLHLARARGVQGAVTERLFRARLAEGERLGERPVLARLGAEAGLDAGEVRRALQGDDFGDAVRADEAAAERDGIHAVPFFVLAGEWAVPGAQPAEVLHGALAQAWADAASRAASPRARRGRAR